MISTMMNDFTASLLAAVLSCLLALMISGYVFNPLPYYMLWAKYIVPFGYSYNTVVYMEFIRDYSIQ